jgi:hypothetical protein
MAGLHALEGAPTWPRTGAGSSHRSPGSAERRPVLGLKNLRPARARIWQGGSTVRVRQRASRTWLQSGRFCCLRGRRNRFQGTPREQLADPLCLTKGLTSGRVKLPGLQHFSRPDGNERTGHRVDAPFPLEDAVGRESVRCRLSGRSSLWVQCGARPRAVDAREDHVAVERGAERFFLDGAPLEHVDSRVGTPLTAARRSRVPAQRSDLNASRSSPEKVSGSSHAAKWPPLSTSLK